MSTPNTHEASEWETELLLITGNNRGDLLERIGQWQAYCEQNPGLSLTDLAFTLNTQSHPGASRLAIIAKNLDDAIAKLQKASERLSDSNRTELRDVQGIYFTETPLAQAGKIALLFPGEGAPYVGMLAGLAEKFPAVANVIAECDEMSREQSAAPLSRFLHAVDDADAKAALETELHGLGNTMFSVLMVDWALADLFASLGIAGDAVAGHSAGELAALWLSRSLVGELDMPEVRRTMDSLESDEENTGTESVLLAVGTSRETMQQILDEAQKQFPDIPLFLAMDNCPHQTVAIGPLDAMASVASVLKERKIMHERLPFNRPYHTPLFEPQMGPLAQMFDGMEFQSPETELYSCTTGKPFPQDPDAFHQLAMSHWVERVEFSQMIRNMHDDGVRIFLELGPRGNLTSFVSDILRGRDFLAVSGDVQRHSTLTQLHHVLGQLFVHHVPMQLAELYAHRNVQSLYPAAEEDSQMTETAPIQPATGRASVVNQYWNVMGDFLDLNQNVMQQYLHRMRSGQAGQPMRKAVPQIPAFEFPAAQTPDAPQPKPAPIAEPTPAPVEPVTIEEHNLPLVQTVKNYLPGQEIIVRRTLDLAEDIYGDHHTVGGREVSYVYPERNGQPVVPMTFSLELMAEAATLAVPGLVVTAIRNVQLVRWLTFDEDAPHTVELTAKILNADTEAATLEMRIFDLGSEPDNPKKTDHKGDLAAVSTVEMAAAYPAPPAVEDFPLTGERPCRIPLDVLYKNLFHGEFFQGVMSMDRYGEEGIQGQIRVLPREGLFRSNPDPQFVLDPVLMDVAMHPLAGWHLEQPDQSGRILLPYELGDIRFYGPRPAVDTELTSRGRIVHESSRRFTHTVDVVGPNDRIWCTMEKLKYWRFYLPFGEFNFHGPKDDYFLSDQWPETLPAEHPADDACCVGLMPPRDLQAPGMMLASARVTLTREELRVFRKLDQPDTKKSQWLFGRMAAKDAARILWRQHTGERMVPADIAIEPDENGRPIASPLGQDRPANFPQVSIAHTDGLVASLGSMTHAPGIDLEMIATREESFVKAAFRDSEQVLISAQKAEREEIITRFWCAKEAVSKALGQGLVEGPQSLTVTAYQPDTGEVIVEIGDRLAARLPDGFSQGPVAALTVRRENFIVATVLLENSQLCPAPLTTSSEKSPNS